MVPGVTATVLTYGSGQPGHSGLWGAEEGGIFCGSSRGCQCSHATHLWAANDLQGTKEIKPTGSTRPVAPIPASWSSTSGFEDGQALLY